MRFREAVSEGKQILAQAGIADAAVDAEILLLQASGLDRAHYLAGAGDEVPGGVLETYRALVARRAGHVPLQHITGSQEFMGIDFSVSGDVLVPRQDTETLAEEAIRILREKRREGRALRVLDLCTGSGCILISLKKFCPYIAGTGTDISPRALDMARRNAQNANVQVSFLEADLFHGISEQERFDLITCNPPYIPSSDIDRLSDEVRDHEPRIALDGGEDGLSFYRRIAAESRPFLRKDGVLLMEIGYDQGRSVPDLFQKAGYEDIHVLRDMAGLDRVVRCRRPARDEAG